MEIFLYLAIGITIGCLSGMLGIGGGVLIIPALIWLCGFPLDKASGTSLAILVPPIGLPAAYYYWHHGKVDVWAALWIALAFALGALGGSFVVKHKLLNEMFLRLMFGLVMIYIAIQMILASSSQAAEAAAGLVGTALAWIGFLWLRFLGRKHVHPPDLGDQIRKMHEEGRGDPEYHI
jgi:uncharacterized membrane protein YfcA